MCQCDIEGMWAILIGPTNQTGPQVLDSLWSTKENAWQYVEANFPAHLEQGLIAVEWQRIED